MIMISGKLSMATFKSHCTPAQTLAAPEAMVDQISQPLTASVAVVMTPETADQLLAIFSPMAQPLRAAEIPEIISLVPLNRLNRPNVVFRATPTTPRLRP